MKSCIVVEDEPLSRQLLEHYAGLVANLEVRASFGDVQEALLFVQRNPVDVVLLDSVELPVLPQSCWMQLVDLHPNVIIVSAYPSKMLNIRHKHVRGMLEKPFSYHDFQRLLSQVLN